MGETTVDPELQGFITILNGAPSYPTIGRILKHFATIIGMTENEHDQGKSFRQTLLRLEKQQPGTIDLDRYQETLWSIVHEYEEVTESYEFHWLAGSQIFHYLSAYQQLISYYPVIGFSKDEIDSLVGFSFLYWSLLRFAWWLKKNTNKATEHALPWWFTLSPNSGDGFTEAVDHLKQLLDDRTMSDWQLIKTVYRSDTLSKEEISDKIKQLNSWRRGKTTPKYWTLYYQLIAPLSKSFPVVARTFQLDIISWLWIKEWAAMIHMAPEVTQARLLDVFGSVLESDDIMETNIPSNYLMEIGSLHRSLAILIRFIIPDIVKDKDPVAVVDLYSRESFASLYSMKKRELSHLIEVAQHVEYINGNDYRKLTTYLLKNLLTEKSNLIEPVFKSAYLHGLIKSGYRDAKTWLHYNRAHLRDMDALARERGEMLGTSRAVESWLGNWDDKSIDEQKPVGEYNRTRLMVAAYRGDIHEFRKLIRHGCDITLCSKDSKITMGDNSTALMMALKGYEEPFTKMQRENSFKIVSLLLSEIERAGKNSAFLIVNAVHAITKRTPLSVALDLGNLPLSGKLIMLGARVDLPSGGDNFYPIYEAVNAYAHCIHPSHTEQALFKAENLNRFNMENPPEMMDSLRSSSNPEAFKRIINDSITITRFHKSNRKSDYLGIIKLLVQNGANINQLNTNGRYPLDFAIEIGDNNLIQSLCKLGAKKRAIY